jgi:hypothetical protein
MGRYPDTVRAVLDGGHGLGNHSWGHLRPTDASSDMVMDEVNKAQQQIAAYGVASKLYRPRPGKSITDADIDRVLISGLAAGQLIPWTGILKNPTNCYLCNGACPSRSNCAYAQLWRKR